VISDWWLVTRLRSPLATASRRRAGAVIGGGGFSRDISDSRASATSTCAGYVCVVPKHRDARHTCGVGAGGPPTSRRLPPSLGSFGETGRRDKRKAPGFSLVRVRCMLHRLFSLDAVVVPVRKNRTLRPPCIRGFSARSGRTAPGVPFMPAYRGRTRVHVSEDPWCLSIGWRYRKGTVLEPYEIVGWAGGPGRKDRKVQVGGQTVR